MKKLIFPLVVVALLFWIFLDKCNYSNLSYDFKAKQDSLVQTVDSLQVEIAKSDSVINNLNILEHLGEHERIISLLNELSKLFVEKTIYFNNISHGGYIPIKCSDNYNKVIIESVDENLLCLKKNIEYYNIKNTFGV